MKNACYATGASHGADCTSMLLQQILRSAPFARARRMRELLLFLVTQKLSGSQRDTHEYAVGIEVFGRDAATYNTCTDPIVRVQVGRLRERLRAYYDGEGAYDSLRFVIPVGSYMPQIVAVPDLAACGSRAALTPKQIPAPAYAASHYLLVHSPLACPGDDAAVAAFARGLDEELAHQLYCAFGAAVVPHTDAGRARALSHRLEGSVRIDGRHVRLTLRLVDNRAGSMVWSRQFDQSSPLSIALQETLAASACTALEEYFAHG
jgi:TolB-like protein